MTLTWTDERVQRVRDLTRLGWPASKIADNLGNGITRSAVCGLQWRLKCGRQSSQSAPHKWTDDDLALLRSGYAYGTATLEIAEAIGVSVSSIKRKATRLGLRRSGPLPHRTDRKYPLIDFVRLLPPRASGKIDAPQNVQLLDLSPRHCRYIVSGAGISALFCGNAKDTSSSYCAGHRRICTSRVTETADERQTRWRLQARRAA